MGLSARFDARFYRRLPLQLLSSAIMAAVLWGMSELLADQLATAGVRYLALLALVTVGAITYFAAAHVTGALRLSELRASMRRRPS
jgi:putative peptidoglycan lipid II flippase